MIHFTVPLIPPSVNHYVTHGAAGHCMTGPAGAFRDAVILLGRGRGAVTAEAFEVETRIHLGKGQKGDVDNFPKLILDGLALAGTFQTNGAAVSDSHVTDLIVRKRRDNQNPRTEIFVAPAKEGICMMYIPTKAEKEEARRWLADPNQCPVDLIRTAVDQHGAVNMETLAELLVMYASSKREGPFRELLKRWPRI